MEAAQHPWPALGVLLVRDGLVSKDELQSILAEQHDARHKRISGHQLGALLVARGAVTPTQIARLVAEQYELPFLELEVNEIDARLAQVLDREISERLGAVPISHKPDGSYVLAIADPATVLFSDELRRALGSPTHFAVVGPEAIEAALAFVWEGRPHVVQAAVESPEEDQTMGVVVELRSAEPAGTVTFDDSSAVEAPTVAHVRPPLGAMLLREGLVSEEELDQALAQQSLSTSWRLGEILVDRGIVTTAVVARMIAEQYELPYFELELLRVDPAVATLLPREIARTFPAVPVAVLPDGTVELAIADPANFSSSDALLDALDAPLALVVAAPDAIEALIDASHAAMTVVEDEFAEQPAWYDVAASPVELESELEATVETFENAAATPDLPDYVVDLPTSPATDLPFASATPPTFQHYEQEPVDLQEKVHHLPEFSSELFAADESPALEEVRAEEPIAAEANVDPFASWPAELHVADPIEVVEHENDHSDVSEPSDRGAEELTSALLAEVTESYDSPEPEPEYHSANEAWFAGDEIEPAEESAVADVTVETTEPEAVLSLVEVDPAGFTSEGFDPPEPEHRSANEDWFAGDELDRTDDTAVLEAVVEPAEPVAPPSAVELDLSGFVQELDEATAPLDELAVEDPAAYAVDLDAAIDEVLALGASAIHFSPQGEWHTVRARIDGLVRDLGVVAREDMSALVERVGASAAMRVDVVPTKQGDKVILFPREQTGAPRTLDALGLTSEATETLRSALALPSGAIVVCGPVGSGTTTTLYAALGAFSTPERVVASVEDPVERVLEGVDQIEVDTARGVTFANGLQTLLATDCDGVLVGDIRDPETAGIALQAALDGRYVLAGVRAPSSAAAIVRLSKMELDPNVLGVALACVVAQRLVRRVCANCRETYYASESELAELGQLADTSGPRLLARGRGCDVCDGTGFRGRIGLFEILTVTEEIRTLVGGGAPAKKIQRAAVAAGMRTLRDEGVRLCLEGVTTAQEIQRVLGAER